MDETFYHATKYSKNVKIIIIKFAYCTMHTDCKYFVVVYLYNK